MSLANLASLLPLVILAVATVLVIAMIAVRRTYLGAFIVAFAGFAGAFASLFGLEDARIGALLYIDGYARFFSAVAIGANACVLLLSYTYLKRYDENREEFFVLLLLETMGAVVLVSSVHFASFFLGLELLSVSLYALLAYVRTRRVSLEAGLKYFVPAAVSSAFLLFGMALLYGETGTMEFSGIGSVLTRGIAETVGSSGAAAGSSGYLLLVVGLGMVIVAVGFKLALVPFHMWAADVYEGSSAPVTASIATVSKVAMFALFFRFLAGIDLGAYPVISWVLVVVAVLSMIGGSWLALLQTNVKRMLAYSSTAHLGYMMMPLLAGGNRGAAAAAFYLVAYSVTSIGLFGIVTRLSSVEGEAGELERYAGLAWTRPALAFAFTVMLLSIAGIPLTAGFIGKFYLLTTGVGSSLWVLAAALVVSSALGIFYYLRVVGTLLARGVERAEPSHPAERGAGAAVGGGAAVGTDGEPRSLLVGLVLVVAVAAVIGLGIYPTPLVSLIASIVPAL